jgi:hypothetical protein
MTIDPNTIGDEREPNAEDDRPFAFEFNETSLGSSHLLSSLTRMQELIALDKPITAKRLQNLDDSTGRAGVCIHAGCPTSLRHVPEDATVIRTANAMRQDSIPSTQLRYMTDATARRLVKETGSIGIYLNDLQFLADTQAEILATYEGNCIHFGSLKKLTNAQSRALSHAKANELAFENLRSVSDIQCEILSTFTGQGLRLSVLECSDKQLQQLVGFGGEFLGIGLQTLTDRQATLLASFRGTKLQLDQLRLVTAHQASLLIHGKESLYVAGLRSITEEQACSFAKLEGSLGITGIESFSDGVATQLSNFKGKQLYINGIEDLPEHQADILSALRGKCSVECNSRVQLQLFEAYERKQTL